MVVQADEGCQESVGSLVRLPTKDPKTADRGRLQRRQPGLPAADARAVAMLCPGCRRQLDRGGGFCLNCGMPRPGHVAPLELVLGDRTRVPVVEEMTIGRAPGSTVVLEDPTVSRLHARISAQRRRHGDDRGRRLQPRHVGRRRADRPPDASCATGSSSGSATRRCASSAAGTTRRRVARSWCARARAWSSRPWARPDVTSQATQFGMRPRIRSGYALKRLEADEGRKRWVLKDLNTNTYLRLSDNDAKIFEQLDGTRSLVDLIGFAEQRFGPGGPGAARAPARGPRRARLPGRRRPLDAGRRARPRRRASGAGSSARA